METTTTLEVETTQPTATPSPREIRKLVKRAFGLNFRSDLDYSRWYGGEFYSTNMPLGIAKIPLFVGILYYNIVGFFEDKEGRILVVREKFLEDARKYASFYESQFSIRPRIKLVDSKVTWGEMCEKIRHVRECRNSLKRGIKVCAFVDFFRYVFGCRKCWDLNL